MRKLGWFIPAMAWMGLIFGLSSRRTVPEFIGLFPGLDKVVHAGFYGALAALLLWGHGRARAGAPKLFWRWVLLASLYGVTDEYHQSFVPGRSCDWQDWLADTVGAAISVNAGRLLYKERVKDHAANV